jgi:hypothetical protein
MFAYSKAVRWVLAVALVALFLGTPGLPHNPDAECSTTSSGTCS